jgi:hypothetical protein
MTATYDAGGLSGHDKRTATRVAPLREWILTHFPAGAHPVTLVHDADRLLADETILAKLARRGFRLVSESDPVALRYQAECARPWTHDRPLIVRTESRLNELPYDLWQPGHRVELGLHVYFPHLDYPTIRQLGPLARARLSLAPRPAEPLGPRSTTEHLLRHAYDVNFATLQDPAALLTWLADYHALGEPMPAALATRFVAALEGAPRLVGWGVAALLDSGDALQSFLTKEWIAYLMHGHGTIDETRARYSIDFRNDPAVQDAVSRWVRSGVLTPVTVPDPSALPAWARPAIRAAGADDTAARMAALSDTLGEALRADLRSASWSQWVDVARSWGTLQALHDAAAFLTTEQREAYLQIQHAIDTQFAVWLPSHYSGLAAVGLPTPHHLFHVPGFIAYEWRTRPVERIALLIIDGMALRDWTLIGPIWKERHPDWALREQLLLAEAPTLTAVSRQALVSGSRPMHFAASLDTNRFEQRQWAASWARQDPALPEPACHYARLRTSASVTSLGSRVRAACFVESSIDEIVHGATLGAADVQASLSLWLSSESHALEREIARLLEQGCRVYVTSDHGHVEAVGMGTLSEGVIAETRGKRARVYRSSALAERAESRFPDTIIWADDGILPNDVYVVIPHGRKAFAPAGDCVVTHGGTTIDELVVPFMTIERRG